MSDEATRAATRASLKEMVARYAKLNEARKPVPMTREQATAKPKAEALK